MPDFMQCFNIGHVSWFGSRSAEHEVKPKATNEREQLLHDSTTSLEPLMGDCSCMPNASPSEERVFKVRNGAARFLVFGVAF